MIKPGNFYYIADLIQGARYFAKALRKVMIDNLRLKRQKKEILAAKLTPPNK